MYIVRNEDGRFLEGCHYTTPIWKNHYSRAALFELKADAFDTCVACGVDVDDIEVIDLSEYEES